MTIIVTNLNLYAGCNLDVRLYSFEGTAWHPGADRCQLSEKICPSLLGYGVAGKGRHKSLIEQKFAPRWIAIGMQCKRSSDA